MEGFINRSDVNEIRGNWSPVESSHVRSPMESLHVKYDLLSSYLTYGFILTA